MAFEGEDVLRGPEDRFDPLADRGEVRAAAGFVVAAGRMIVASSLVDGRTVSVCYPYTTIVGAAELGYDVERRLPPGRILPIELWPPRSRALRLMKFNFASRGAMPALASSKPGPRMNAREKTNRDNEIVAARMRGLSWATIAGSFGLTERQCQNILADYRASHPRLRERDPIEIVDDMIDRYEAAHEELALGSATPKRDAKAWVSVARELQDAGGEGSS